ncbi:MAG: hypothetical protein OTJ44_00455 [Planctomycetota bacterium]|mgnify:CR=1 FL=1|nr:hypothetical protein [Planctomycetota bacterium]
MAHHPDDTSVPHVLFATVIGLLFTLAFCYAVAALTHAKERSMERDFRNAGVTPIEFVVTAKPA